MNNKHSFLDNYLLSIPAEQDELWRTGLQGLYENMKLSVVNPLVIDEQYFDVHDELSDEHDERYGVSVSQVIVGARKLYHQDFLPRFIEHHSTFLNLTEQLFSLAMVKERPRIAQEIASTYKQFIDDILSVREREFSLTEILTRIPEEFNLPEIIERTLDGYRSYLDCFEYPRCKGRLTHDYSASLGDYVLFKSDLEGLSAEELIFQVHDDPFYEDLHPGGLSSYKGRLRFVKETLEDSDLVQWREKKVVQSLDSRTRTFK